MATPKPSVPQRKPGVVSLSRGEKPPSPRPPFAGICRGRKFYGHDMGALRSALLTDAGLVPRTGYDGSRRRYDEF